jgi:hypothetical protein
VAGTHEVIGRITIVQEERFRLVTPDGRSLLLTLAHSANVDPADLHRFRQGGAAVRVVYDGAPDLDSGSARRVEAAGPAPG